MADGSTSPKTGGPDHFELVEIAVIYDQRTAASAPASDTYACSELLRKLFLQPFNIAINPARRPRRRFGNRSADALFDIAH